MHLLTFGTTILFEEDTKDTRPKFVYNLDSSESAYTFGVKNKMQIGMEGGLVGKKFRNDPSGFMAILLHEMGHIFNKDVGKAYIVLSTWNLFKVFINVLAVITFLDVFFFVILLRAPLNRPFIEIILYLLFLSGIVFILRNKVIRFREFYADAKVAEWDNSPERIIKTLDESRGKDFSEFKILKQFHPNPKERIHFLKNNKGLFIPSLGV